VGARPQPPREAARLVRQLAEAIHHAHICGVIHRDLKPANILFTDSGTPKVGDFGAARLTDSAPGDGPSALTRHGDVIGTPEYMAPERARGTVDEITSRVDVYALEAALYQLLTGRPPHTGADSYDILTSVIQREPLTPRRLAPGVPADLETVCLKAMAKNPADRYASASECADDLGRFLNGEPILARPESAVARL
jgi:serine/threonine-protein kinase